MSEIGYGEFSRVLHDKLPKERMPLDVTLEITHRCPLECQHCYNNLPMADRDAANRELTLDEYKVLLDELVAAGTFWLLFSGGEPFARKDFLDIYTYAKHKGFLITIFTNGTVITPAIADHLAEFPPFSIEITLYGATRHTYEQMTQQPGSYDRCMRGINLLLERKLPLKLKTVPTSINKHEVSEMRKFAEGLGLEFKFDSLINPRIDCSQSPIGVRLTPEEVVAFDMEPQRKSEYRQLLDRDLAAGPPADGNDVYVCGGGVLSCSVDPYGQMSICVISKRTEYNIRNGGFQHGWRTALRDARLKKRTRPSKCSSCQIRSMCGMCPANGELEHDDPESPVDFLCHVTHLRTMALGSEVPPHGDCEFCHGRSKYADLKASLDTLPHTVEQLALPSPVLLPILASSASGCGVGKCGH